MYLDDNNIMFSVFPMIITHNIIIIAGPGFVTIERRNITYYYVRMLTENGIRIPDPTRPNHPNLYTIKNPRVASQPQYYRG